MKFRGVQKLMILRCFMILYVQILSGCKNWDIQDLTLRRYDAIKTCRWNFFKFSWVVHYREICKNQIEKPCFFLEVNYKCWKKETVFVYILDFIFYGVSRAKTDLQNKYIFNFLFGSFFEQDHLLNLFNLGVYAKKWPKCARISKQKLSTTP